MKINTKSILGFLTLFVAISFFGCNNDDDGKQVCMDPSNPECENYDPCLNSSEVSAEFIIEEQLGSSAPWFNQFVQDSIVWKKTLKFRAIDTLADFYKWYLGTEILEGDDLFEVQRDINSLSEGVYPVSLVVEKTPDSICFPLDDGIDSVQNSFFKVNVCDLSVINRFKGVFQDQPNDTMIIELALYINDGITFTPNCISGATAFHCINFFRNQDTIGIDSRLGGIVNTKLVFNGSGTSAAIIGEVSIDQQEVHATYSYRGLEYNFQGKIFN